jgi:FixJ family two-component response regulator
MAMADVAVSRDLILSALERLTTEQRAVIVHAYYQCRTTGQIAADLHIDEGTVRMQMHHGLRALRAAFQERGVRPAWGYPLASPRFSTYPYDFPEISGCDDDSLQDHC